MLFIRLCVNRQFPSLSLFLSRHLIQLQRSSFVCFFPSFHPISYFQLLTSTSWFQIFSNSYSVDDERPSSINAFFFNFSCFFAHSTDESPSAQSDNSNVFHPLFLVYGEFVVLGISFCACILYAENDESAFMLFFIRRYCYSQQQLSGALTYARQLDL